MDFKNVIPGSLQVVLTVIKKYRINKIDKLIFYERSKLISFQIMNIPH